MSNIIKLFLLILCFLSIKTAIASYSISPVKPRISKDVYTISLDFTYTKKSPADTLKKYFQVILEPFSKKENSSIRKSTSVNEDLIVSPYIFSLNPGQTQKIRFALKKHIRNNRPEKEKIYKVAIEELPNKKLEAHRGLSFLYKICVFLTIAPEKLTIVKPQCSYKESSHGISVSVKNDSNILHKVSALKVTSQNGKKKDINTLNYIFPESQVSFQKKSPVKIKDLSLYLSNNVSDKKGFSISCKKTI